MSSDLSSAFSDFPVMELMSGVCPVDKRFRKRDGFGAVIEPKVRVPNMAGWVPILRGYAGSGQMKVGGWTLKNVRFESTAQVVRVLADVWIGSQWASNSFEFAHSDWSLALFGGQWVQVNSLWLMRMPQVMPSFEMKAGAVALKWDQPVEYKSQGQWLGVKVKVSSIDLFVDHGDVNFAGWVSWLVKPQLVWSES